jgi:hypothetical protein
LVADDNDNGGESVGGRGFGTDDDSGVGGSGLIIDDDDDGVGLGGTDDDDDDDGVIGSGFVADDDDDSVGGRGLGETDDDDDDDDGVNGRGFATDDDDKGGVGGSGFVIDAEGDVLVMLDMDVDDVLDDVIDAALSCSSGSSPSSSIFSALPIFPGCFSGETGLLLSPRVTVPTFLIGLELVALCNSGTSDLIPSSSLVDMDLGRRAGFMGFCELGWGRTFSSSFLAFNIFSSVSLLELSLFSVSLSSFALLESSVLSWSSFPSSDISLPFTILESPLP